MAGREERRHLTRSSESLFLPAMTLASGTGRASSLDAVEGFFSQPESPETPLTRSPAHWVKHPSELSRAW